MIRTFYAMAFAACVGIAANAASAECRYQLQPSKSSQRLYELRSGNELDRLQECRTNTEPSSDWAAGHTPQTHHKHTKQCSRLKVDMIQAISDQLGKPFQYQLVG